jgi:hypothetical protein
LSVKGNVKTLQRQIDAQFQGKRQISFAATHHEIGHGPEITWALRAKEAPEHIKTDWPGSAWIVELVASGSHDGKPFKARHLFRTSLRTTAEALLRLIRERWSIESWHWIRDTQLHEDKHRYKGNGAGVLATLRTAALKLLRLGGFVSIRDGLHVVMDDIKELLGMAMQQPREKAR